MSKQFHEYDALGLAAAIEIGDLSAVEAVTSAIHRIETLDSRLNAVIATRFEEAIAETKAGLPDGPLRGVPVLIKALGADVEGLTTTRGSRLWLDQLPGTQTRDSELVRRYRAAGMVVLGLTNTPELGKNASTEPVVHGPTRNPWAPDHEPGYSTGGSSGGSAAAVAVGMVPVAHANDGGGSIRIPAAMCGLFGLKPSRGRISPAPYLSALSNATSVQHAITRTVRDSAVLLDISAGSLPGDAYGAPTNASTYLSICDQPPPRLRIGLLTELRNGPPTHPEAVAAAERMAKVCEDLDHEVIAMPVGWDSAMVSRASGAIMGASMVVSVDERLAQLGRSLREDDLEPFSRVMYDHYRTSSGPEILAALEDFARTGAVIAESFAEVDLLLTPVVCAATPELGFLDTTRPETLYEHGPAFSGWTAPSNVSGMPAMSVPAGLDDRGLPVGAQFVAAYGREDLLLQLATTIEEAAPWPTLAPSW